MISQNLEITPDELLFWEREIFQTYEKGTVKVRKEVKGGRKG
jgi:hypothetical protein